MAMVAEGGSWWVGADRDSFPALVAREFPRMNAVYARHFASDPPARSTIQAAGLPKGARVEIDAIAVG